MKVSANFDIREFVPRELWNQKGAASMWYVNPVMIELAQFNKDFFSNYFEEEISVTINDWLWGGGFNESGYRFPNTDTGSPLSFHRGGLCSAIDCKYKFKRSGETISANEIREIIIQHEKQFMAKGLTTLESGRFAPTWVHQDCRNTGLDNIKIVGI